MSKIDWIDKDERLPTQADADVYGCLVAWHQYNGLTVTGWRRVLENELIVAWAHTPAGPKRRTKDED